MYDDNAIPEPPPEPEPDPEPLVACVVAAVAAVTFSYADIVHPTVVPSSTSVPLIEITTTLPSATLVALDDTVYAGFLSSTKYANELVHDTPATPNPRHGSNVVNGIAPGCTGIQMY